MKGTCLEDGCLLYFVLFEYFYNQTNKILIKLECEYNRIGGNYEI